MTSSHSLHLAGDDPALQTVAIIVQFPGAPNPGDALKHGVVDKQCFVLHKRQMIARIGVAVEADPDVEMITGLIFDLIEF